MEATTAAGMHSKPGADHNRFVIDLTAYERQRIGAVLEAMPDWDPGAVLVAETEADARLYSGLDAEQRAVYDLLSREGVLDARR
jgi:hypothetical protein